MKDQRIETEPKTTAQWWKDEGTKAMLLNEIPKDEFRNLIKIAKDSPSMFLDMAENYPHKLELIRYASFRKNCNKTFMNGRWVMSVKDSRLLDLDVWVRRINGDEILD